MNYWDLYNIFDTILLQYCKNIAVMNFIETSYIVRSLYADS